MKKIHQPLFKAVTEKNEQISIVFKLMANKATHYVAEQLQRIWGLSNEEINKLPLEILYRDGTRSFQYFPKSVWGIIIPLTRHYSIILDIEERIESAKWTYAKRFGKQQPAPLYKSRWKRIMHNFRRKTFKRKDVFNNAYWQLPTVKDWNTIASRFQEIDFLINLFNGDPLHKHLYYWTRCPVIPKLGDKNEREQKKKAYSYNFDRNSISVTSCNCHARYICYLTNNV